MRMNKTVKNLLLFVGFPILIAGNAYFYFVEKAKQLPELELILINGDKLNLSALTGKPALLNFWATTCTPCRKEMPDLARLYRSFSAKGVRVVGIAMSYDRPDQVIAFQQKYQIPYTLALDLDSTAAKAFDVVAIPETVLISPRGQVVYRHSGVINIEDMQKRIAAMLPDERK
ncbi:MAG: TlpA disulfide reductase family protein [Gammaproteobacteria bacterium]|nr:MAG: TlpA disulfide reductase family protein [Gammaproteobacteria bacterium]